MERSKMTRNRITSLHRRVQSILSLSLLGNHFPALHGLRVIAMISVVQVHISLNLNRPPWDPVPKLLQYSSRITFGMDLFFILSGFLIGMMLFQSQEGRGLKGVGRFYYRRAFKIFPLYYFVLTYMALFLQMPHERLQGLLQEYLYLTNYGDATFRHRVMFWGWSLSVEEHFYLVAPFLIAGLGRLSTHRQRIGVLLALWVSGFASRVVTAHYAFQASDYSFLTSGGVFIRTHTRYDILIAGVIVAYLQYYFRNEVVQFLRKKLVRPCFTCLILFCFYLLAIRPEWVGGDSTTFLLFAWGTITSVAYVPLLLMAVNGDGPLVRFSSSGIFRVIASLGYGVYLVHTPVCTSLLPLARHALLNSESPLVAVWLTMLFATILISLFLAYVLHIIVEKPALRFRDRLFSTASSALPGTKAVV